MMFSAAWQLFKKLAPFLFIAALLAAIWIHGYRTADVKRIQELAAIQAQSDALLDANIKQNAINEASARQFNQQLEASHAQSVATINTYHDNLAGRLHDSRARCSNPMPKDTNTGHDPENAENGAELSAEFTAFLRSETLRADMAALDKNLLLEFINNKCGIRD